MDYSPGGGVTSVISLSEDGEYAAALNGKDLVIHSHTAFPKLREVDAVKVKEGTLSFLKFSRAQSVEVAAAGQSLEADIHSVRRLLFASAGRISVWQLKPLQSYAEIEGIGSETSNIDFGSDENEIIVFHAWNIKTTIFSLDTGRSHVIKAPKFAHQNGFGYRPKTRQFAILLKPDATDLLTIHETRTYELINRAVLPTVDAQGLRWSPDGKWIAVWDVASAGTKVLVFTADGQLLRTYTGPPGFDDSFDLGVKSIEWSPVSDSKETSDFLAVGKVDGNVDILQSKTFSCSISLSHTPQINQQSPTVWRERYSTPDGDLEYAEESSSSAFTTTAEPVGRPRGVSIMAFNLDGSLLATVDQLRPRIVWIWSLVASPRLVSALIHEHAVRQIVWHPWQTELLITTVNSAATVVRRWSPSSDPAIVRISIPRSDSGGYDVRWVTSRQDGHPAFWFGAAEDYVVGYLGVQDGVLKFNSLHSINVKA